MNNRLEYIVIEDFEGKVPVGHTTVLYSYKVGKTIRLRPSGRLAQEWLRKGYIKQV